ncbi:MAG: hypothetical protein HQL53_06620 [Magnetococcales bacterium]|nr:hypothetical protein [Magnetococcales bacterium]
MKTLHFLRPLFGFRTLSSQMRRAYGGTHTRHHMFLPSTGNIAGTLARYRYIRHSGFLHEM